MNWSLMTELLTCDLRRLSALDHVWRFNSESCDKSHNFGVAIIQTNLSLPKNVSLIDTFEQMGWLSITHGMTHHRNLFLFLLNMGPQKHVVLMFPIDWQRFSLKPITLNRSNVIIIVYCIVLLSFFFYICLFQNPLFVIIVLLLIDIIST